MTKKLFAFRIPHSAFVWILFAVVIVVVYFFGLSIPLLGPDEPRYAEVAREMFLRGDFVTPTLGGFDWFEKPALLYWLQIISYKLFGVSEFAARFGSAVFGLGTIFCLWILGKSVQSPKSKVRSPKSEKQNLDSAFSIYHSSFANWLALIAASSIGLIAFSHAASFDIILTFPITAALAAFFIFDQSEKKSGFTFYFLLFTFYFFVGVALIAKGLIGIIFPFAIVAFYYLLSRKLPSKTFIFSLFGGTILSLLVASIWYLPMYQANGWKFIDEFIIQQHFERYVSNKYLHPQPFWFFFLVLPLMTIPWLPFFLASIWKFAKDFFQREDAKARRELRITNYELRIFAFAWMLVPLVFFSLSGSKLPGYILPALPAALILTAEYVYRFVKNNPRRKIALQFLAAAVFVCVMIALQFFVESYARNDTVKNLIASANAQGFADAKILNLFDISHNAEFYGAGRLIRTADGKQKRFDGAAEIYEELKNENKPALILVPLDDVKYLTESDLLTAKVLDDNGELAIVAVEAQR
ncbi:MAG: ArnT family glycosyltransferase [Pyrinomonadaceae bacterium]